MRYRSDKLCNRKDILASKGAYLWEFYSVTVEYKTNMFRKYGIDESMQIFRDILVNFEHGIIGRATRCNRSDFQTSNWWKLQNIKMDLLLHIFIVKYKRKHAQKTWLWWINGNILVNLYHGVIMVIGVTSRCNRGDTSGLQLVKTSKQTLLKDYSQCKDGYLITLNALKSFVIVHRTQYGP